MFTGTQDVTKPSCVSTPEQLIGTTHWEHHQQALLPPTVLLIDQPANEKQRIANDFQDMITEGKKPGLQMLKHAGLAAWNQA